MFGSGQGEITRDQFNTRSMSGTASEAGSAAGPNMGSQEKQISLRSIKKRSCCGKSLCPGKQEQYTAASRLVQELTKAAKHLGRTTCRLHCWIAYSGAVTALMDSLQGVSGNPRINEVTDF